MSDDKKTSLLNSSLGPLATKGLEDHFKKAEDWQRLSKMFEPSPELARISKQTEEFQRLASGGMPSGLSSLIAASQRTPARKLTVGRGVVTIDLPVKPAEPPLAGPDEDVKLNVEHRFRLEPDDGQPVEFIGTLIATATVERGETQRTWVGLYRTRGGKFISEIDRRDGRSRNVVWDLGDKFLTVKVFETREDALASIRSTALRNQLLKDLGLLTTRFIE